MQKQLQEREKKQNQEARTQKRNDLEPKSEAARLERSGNKKLELGRTKILEIIEEKLDEESEEAQYAAAGITGSEFFKKFNEENERKSQIEKDANFIGNQIEAYLNRQRQEELDEFAELEKRINRSKR